VLPRRTRPICDVPAIGIGSQPIDDGNFLFTPEQKREFLDLEPAAAKFFHPWIGSEEFINGIERWCLWLGNAMPAELRAMPQAMRRMQAVRTFREKSRRKQTVVAAARPAHFGTELIPEHPYLVIPKVSSERRMFIPIGFISPQTFCSDLVFMLPNAMPYHFAILTSTMHTAWVRYTSGRLKSDFRYSAAIVYNNFPWPEPPADAQRAAIEAAAQAVLDARAAFPGSTLADLYDPLAMPGALLRAHQKLDAAVDAAYGKKANAFKSDAERVAFLFERYRQLTSLLPAAPAKRSRRAR
jgi:hypothetical protein